MAHSAQTARVIDVHAHAVLAASMGAAGDFGPEIGAYPDGQPWFRVGDYRLDGVRYVGSPFMDTDLRLQRMDEAGIDYQLLSPNPLTYFHFIPAPEAIRFCRAHNDALAATVRSRTGRLGAIAALPMQDIPAACAELRRAIVDLGMLGAQIGTDMPHPLDDPAMDALYAICVELDVPLFIHPSPAGIDGPPGDPALKRFDLDVVVGFAAQEVLAVCTLVYGGVLDRHPELDICLSHGGGSMGYLVGRMKRAVRKRPWVIDALKPDGAFEERLGRLWFDNHLNNSHSLDLLVSLIGDNHLVYGTNFAGWDAPDPGDAHAPEPKLADNARRLLRL
ncbi:amidohydrolase family protein [Pontivivens nitratireducens]|uniref:amidohydrolase family protein n=1 Tax=Pontivivens nitratireducens TaxID=2758038 RepID=UPI00163A61E6|nr:amidohydrolase family protein [Pontibrevibacter nitratireducens]